MPLGGNPTFKKYSIGIVPHWETSNACSGCPENSFRPCGGQKFRPRSWGGPEIFTIRVQCRVRKSSPCSVTLIPLERQIPLCSGTCSVSMKWLGFGSSSVMYQGSVRNSDVSEYLKTPSPYFPLTFPPVR